MARGVTFTRESAERIRDSVLKTEGLRTQPLRYRNAGGRGGDVWRVLIGKTDASHAKSASGTVSIWSGETSGTLADTGDNVTAYNRFADLDSGKWVAVLEAPWGYELIAGECA